MMTKTLTLGLLLILPFTLYAQNREINMHNTTGQIPVLSGGGKLPASSPIILTGRSFTVVKGVYLRYGEAATSTEDIPDYVIPSDTQIKIKAILKKTHDEASKTATADICLRIGDKPDSILDVCTKTKPIVFVTPHFDAAHGDFQGNDHQYQSSYPAAAMVNHGGETLNIHIATNFNFADKATVKFDDAESYLQQTSATTFSTTTPSHPPYGKPKLIVYNGEDDSDLEQAIIKDDSGKFGFYRIKFMCQRYPSESAIPCSTPIPSFTDDPHMTYTFVSSDPEGRCSPHTPDPMYYDHFRGTALLFPESEPKGNKLVCDYVMQKSLYARNYVSREAVNNNRVVDKVLGNNTPEGQWCESTRGDPADCAYRYTVLPPS